jgi:hypothetical protein
MEAHPPELEPLYTEVEAARLLGIEFKWLRAERYNGRISWKKVAGRVMYRHQDLIDWQKRGIPCREEDPTASPGSSSARTRGGGRRSITSAGMTDPGTASVQRALAIAEKLIKSSRGGSSITRTKNAGSHWAPAIPLKRG